MRDLGGHRWDLLLAVAQSLLQGKAGGGEAPRSSEGFFALSCLSRLWHPGQVHEHSLTPAWGHLGMHQIPVKLSAEGSNSLHLHTQHRYTK